MTNRGSADGHRLWPRDVRNGRRHFLWKSAVSQVQTGPLRAVRARDQLSSGQPNPRPGSQRGSLVNPLASCLGKHGPGLDFSVRIWPAGDAPHLNFQTCKSPWWFPIKCQCEEYPVDHGALCRVCDAGPTLTRH